MNIAIAILILVALALIAGVIIFAKKLSQSFKIREQQLVKEIEDRASIITARSIELDQIADSLNIRSQGIQYERMNNIQILNEAKQTEQVTRELLESNKIIVKGNEAQLYHIKETTIYLYDHYKKVVDILHNIMIGRGIEQYELNSTLNTASDNLNSLHNYFYRTFKITPDQYKKLKTNIVGKPKNGDYDFITENSLN